FYYKSFIFFGDPSMYPSIYKHITTDPLTATTWSGNIVLDGPITVSANLTIMPGTNIYFTEGAYLTIGDGTFTADATGGAPITIQTTGNSGSDNLIVFDGASTSNSVLKNVIIRNIGGIQCIDGANITIANDSLINTYDAITAYQCTPQVINNYISNPIFNGIRAISIGSYEYQMPISGNKVIISEVNNNSTTGICIENCNDPMVGSNHIKGFNYGLSIYGSCVFLIDSASMYDYRNNQIINNVNGLYVTGNSTLFAGYENGAFCNYNSIHDNTVYDLYLDNSWAEAYLNYWGDTHRINATNGDLDYDSGLSEDPWENQSFASIRPIKNTGPGIHLNKSMGSVDSNLTNSLSSGILLEKQGKINDAINYYKGLIQQNKNLHFAISELAKIKAKYTRNEISPYLEGLLANNLYYSAVEKLFGDMYLRSNQFDNAIAAYDNVIKNDSVGYDGINARFEKLYANLYIKKNLAAALKILSEIKGMNLTDIDNQMRIQNVERLIASANRRTVKKMSSNVSNIPQSYDLSQNYPNPFNPSTTINYQIPDAAKVSLIIYDILGRQIATLVDEYKSEGRYSVNFNASRFASGVYIYQLRANNFISSKKMLLLK
ncbi:MAG: T9SS type A sorting domain-containing protein, partial [Ignavibacteriaceae bacterium]|nr:T9SS type A sorting domain-containing protein [Ignavibacteriaceae bacterium]